MKRVISIVILSLLINIHFIEFAHAISGSVFRPFKQLFKIFKGPADDAIKNSGKIKEEAISGIKKKSINEGAAGPAQESLVIEKIGIESHLSEFRSLKDSNRTAYIKRLKSKNSRLKPQDFLEDNLLDIFDDNSSSENSIFKTYIIANWIGKIYRSSDYYNKPAYEEKMLLVCSNIDQVFYFSLFMEKEPKRAFLANHKEFKNNKTLLAQELVIIEDNDDVKIMSTMPVNNNKWPSHYFTIYKDQNFYYDQSNSGYVTPEAIKNKVLNNPMGKNNCSKATNNGLL